MNASANPIPGPAGPLMVYRCADRSATADAKWPSVRDPIVFIHPVNTGAGVWDEVASRLSGTRATLAPDLRGHGLSGKAGPFTARDYADDVLAVMNQFSIRSAHLVGGSIGGPVSVLLAATAPERVTSITSLGGAMQLSITDEVLAQVRAMLDHGVEHLIRQLMPAAFAAENRDSVQVANAIAIASSTDRPAQAVFDIIRDAFDTDVNAWASKCNKPCLVINGREDSTCTPEHGRAMAAALGGHAVVLEGCGHLPMLEAVDEVVALIERHISGCERP